MQAPLQGRNKDRLLNVLISFKSSGLRRSFFVADHRSQTGPQRDRSLNNKEDRRMSIPGRSLEGDLAACFFDGLLGSFGFVLGNAFLDGLGSSFHQSLGVAEAEAGGLTDGLEDLDLGGSVEASRMTSNSDFSSAASPPPAAAPGAAITTPAEAAADTPKASSICLTSSEASSRERDFSDSRISSVFADIGLKGEATDQ